VVGQRRRARSRALRGRGGPRRPRQLEGLFAGKPALDDLDPRARADVLASAPGHFAALWPHLAAEADAAAHEAERLLKIHGRGEADALRALLASQLEAGRRVLDGQQLAFDFGEEEAAQREQYVEDRKHLRERLGELKKEMDVEPREIEHSYEVVLRRVEPVGLVYLVAWTR
jgi:hypothetical protein